jgi:hypothetical protein
LKADISAVLKCLWSLPHLTTIIVPGTLSESDQHKLSRFLGTNTTISRLEFVDGAPLLAGIAPALKEYTARGGNPIVSLSFEGLQLTRAHLQILADFCPRQITGLNFKGALTNYVSDFIDLVNNGVFAGVTHLILDNCVGFDLGAILPQMPALSVLSVASCELEVAHILQAMQARANSGMTPLQALILTGNLCRAPIPFEFAIRPMLRSVRANRIAWAGENLRFFWRSFMESQRDSMKLSVAQAGMDSSSWQLFFVKCADIVSDRLLTLDWSYNPLDAAFCGAIAQCSRLENLTVNGCLRRGDPAFATVVEYVRNSEILKDLCISANADAPLAIDELRELARAVQENRSLNRLTISHYRAGRDFLFVMGEALMINRRITYVDLDVNCPGEIEPWKQLLQGWTMRGVPLELRLRLADLEGVADQHPVEYQEVRSLRESVLKGSRGVDVPPESVDRTRRPKQSQIGGSWGGGAYPPSQPTWGGAYPAVMTPPVSSGGTYAPQPVPVADLTVRIKDADAINLAESGDLSLPLPPVPEIDNSFVSVLFDQEFSPAMLIEAIRSQP